MKPSKSQTALTWASGSSTTSGTTNTVNTATDPYDALWGSVVVASGGSTGPTIQLQESVDAGSTWYSPPTKVFSPGIVAATYYFGPIPVDPATNLVQIVYTADHSTLTMQLGQVTQIS